MSIKHLNEKLREADIAGKLSEQEAEEVEEHMLSCSACFQDYYVDLPRERELRAFAAEHRELGQKAFATARGPGLKVRLAHVADAIRAGKDEVRAVLESFLEGARISMLVPQMATIRQAGDTSLVIDQICRDFVVFSGKIPTTEAGAQAFEMTTRMRLMIHYVAEKRALRIRLGESSGGQVSKISIYHTDTGNELGSVQPHGDPATFDIPLDLLEGDVSLSFQ